MSKPQPGAHLAPEDMAAMIDGKLASDERAAVVQHLAECEVCREAMAEHARASSALDQGTGRFGGTAAMVWMSVAATLAMATVAGVLVLRRPPAAIDQPAIDGAPAQPPVVSPAPPPLPAATPPPVTTPDSPEDLTIRRSGTRAISGKTFRLVAGEWIDGAYDPLALLPTEQVEPADRDAALARIPALKPFASLGPRFVVVHDGTVYRFGPR